MTFTEDLQSSVDHLSEILHDMKFQNLMEEFENTLKLPKLLTVGSMNRHGTDFTGLHQGHKEL